MRVLFVSNGHGEIAIAARIADELPAEIHADHLALVGDIAAPSTRLHAAGPLRAMPSGGLVAMGNVRNIVRDAKAGLAGHTLAQLRFLRASRGAYDVAVAVGDVFALLMTLQARARRTVFVGTAKSVYVAPYGALERRLISRAQSVFVRDEATARSLRDRGIAADAANAIVDLYAHGAAPIDAPFDPLVGIFPGSRDAAYVDAPRLCRVVVALARMQRGLGGALSIAPGIDAMRMSAQLAAAGLDVRVNGGAFSPFAVFVDGRETIVAWSGALQSIIARARIVLGQAGTANEAAAAAGIPVVALEAHARPAWYRRRQIALLGDALLLVPDDEQTAASAIAGLLRDPSRLESMSLAGRARMGEPGGARRIAARIAEACE